MTIILLAYSMPLPANATGNFYKLLIYRTILVVRSGMGMLPTGKAMKLYVKVLTKNVTYFEWGVSKSVTGE